MRKGLDPDTHDGCSALTAVRLTMRISANFILFFSLVLLCLSINVFLQLLHLLLYLQVCQMLLINIQQAETDQSQGHPGTAYLPQISWVLPSCWTAQCETTALAAEFHSAKPGTLSLNSGTDHMISQITQSYSQNWRGASGKNYFEMKVENTNMSPHYLLIDKQPLKTLKAQTAHTVEHLKTVQIQRLRIYS